MIKHWCVTLGLNYVWGLANFTAGVMLGCGLTGVIAGMLTHGH